MLAVTRFRHGKMLELSPNGEEQGDVDFFFWPPVFCRKKQEIGRISNSHCLCPLPRPGEGRWGAMGGQLALLGDGGEG